MNILLVNDDGYQAAGIKALDEVLSSYGHNIYVTAPTTEQSAKSHSMTIYGSCYATEYASGRYHITGSPADCIIYGLHSGLLPVKPDLVISGINHGYNLSSDIVYSGTCAAARQSVFYGYKSIAISLGTRRDTINPDFRLCAEFLAKNLEKFYSKLNYESFMNINLPLDFNGEYKLASIGYLDYNDTFRIGKEPDGRFRITNDGCCIDCKGVDGKGYAHDFEICKEGYASISFVSTLPDIHIEAMESFNEY